MMKEINTVMEPFIWNYTQPKGASFSRVLLIDADLTGAEYELKITGAKGTVQPTIQSLKAPAGQTALNISLTAQQSLLLSDQNKWHFKINFKGTTLLGWIGQFNLRQYI